MGSIGWGVTITWGKEWRHVPGVPEVYTPQGSDLSYRHCGHRAASSSCSLERGGGRAQTRLYLDWPEVIVMI